MLFEPARRFGFRDDREDLDGFGRDVIEHSHLPNKAAAERVLRKNEELYRRLA